jgi:hypothetical protein
MIGINCGLTVVDYSDIYGIRVITKSHKTKYRKWKTYSIIIETKDQKRMLLTESEAGNGHKTLSRYLNERFVEHKMLDDQE